MPTAARYMKGKAIQAASRRVAARKVTGGTPMTSSASISSEIRDDPGPDLGGQHVAEGVGDHLAEVAPGGEHAGVGRRADRAVEVRALDPALQAEDEDQAPDHDRGAQDQDARLAQ